MFTGIIQGIGKIQAIESVGGDKRFCFDVESLAGAVIELGDSMAVNGVCLTARELSGNHFFADVSNESLSCTTFGQLSSGDAVNLELAMQPTARLGGHIVSGHVDGVGVLKSRRVDGRSERFEFEAPDSIVRYVAAKGSICIDGTSLTVNGVDGNCFDVNLIPHTMDHTVCGTYRVGTKVNLEVDVVARYVERLLTFGRDTQGLDSIQLAQAGLVTRGV